jgi:sugar lactone lactonase YvrE
MGDYDRARREWRPDAQRFRLAELNAHHLSFNALTNMPPTRVCVPRQIRGHLSTSVFVSGLILATAVATLDASSPRFFRATSQADFLKGDVQGLSVDSRGQLLLGPAAELIYETAAPFLWSVLPGSDGSLLVGTGNIGRVIRIDAQGKGAPFVDTAELEVHALAPAPDGGLFVGTSPDGKIYKVDRNGAATTFFEPGEKYIWALAVDAKGNLYAATGEKGVIYKIAPDGKGARFYQAKATHAIALAFDKAGNLLVGTGSPGRVLRIDADGKAFVLLDSPFQEVRALRFDDKGMLYAAALSGRPGGGSASRSDSDRPAAEPSGTPVASVSTEITSVAIVDTPGSSGSSGSAASPRSDSRSPRGAIYRIAPDGLWDQLWESREDSPYDVIFDAEGRLIIGTGNKGKIYRLEGDPLQPTLLIGASAQQVTSFYKDSRGRLYYATANPGKLFRLAPNRAARGTYESEPRDAQTVATWGAISWRGTTPAGSQIEIHTRSGNTETPDDTWSAWSSPYTRQEGTPIASPKARFLQWRVVLTAGTDSPVLTSVTAAYLQRNLRPQVRSITVHPPGIVFQKPYSTGDPELAGFDNQTTPERALSSAAMSAQGSSGSPSLGRRTYQKGLQTLIWRAEDENDDELTYEIRYRREGETSWKVLRRNVTEPILVWDTTTVPNGTYFVKIVASDAQSNPPGMALTGEMESVAFEIDNTPPEITLQGARVEGGKTIVTFDVQDDHSPIQRVEYSQDGLVWRPAFPRDGIADSKSERYDVTISGEVGPRGLSIRASDAMNNVATIHVDAPRVR